MEGNVRLYRAKVDAGEMTEQEAEAILGKSVWEAQGKLPAMWPTPTTQEVEHPNAIWVKEGQKLRRKGKGNVAQHGFSGCGPNMADTASKGLQGCIGKVFEGN
jgi:hypothetical protein